jgi:hypothetical protein
MDVPEKYRLNRGELEVGSLKDEANDRQYWMSKTPAERLQRVLDVVEFKIR